MKALAILTLSLAASQVCAVDNAVDTSKHDLRVKTDGLAFANSYSFGTGSEIARVDANLEVFQFYTAERENWLSVCRPSSKVERTGELSAAQRFGSAFVEPFTPGKTTIKTTREPVVTKTEKGWEITFRE